MAEESPTPENTAALNPWQALIARIAAWPMSRKLALAAVGLISLGLFAFIIIQSRTADYQLLYANLSESDGSAVINWLKGQNIPYQLINNGKNIKIPADKVYETRLDLAAMDLPQGGGVGFEIFDKQSFALSDFVQKINYTRALQGELSRTISSLGPVESTRVHLAIPEKRLFKDQQKPATASVILKLTRGRKLSESQVQGIIHLVAGSIEGVEPEHVTVIDSNGKVLSSTSSDAALGGISPDMLEFQHQVEQRLEIRAQDLLDTALGPNGSMVRVTATLDFSQVEKTEEIFDPEEPVIRSEQLNDEKSGSEIIGGVPGVQSNLQGNVNKTTSATPPSSKSQKTTNYEISKTISRIVNPVGTIQNLSVAVLVADRVIPAKDKEPEKIEPRSEEELSAIKNMITSALGLNTDRGDKLEVVSMPFVDSAQTAEADGVGANMLYEYLPLAKYALALIGGLLVYLLMIKPLVTTMKEEVTEHYKTVEELEAEQNGDSDQSAETFEETEARKDPIIRLREEAMKNPVPIAHIVKSWVNEG